MPVNPNDALSYNVVKIDCSVAMTDVLLDGTKGRNITGIRTNSNLTTAQTYAGTGIGLKFGKNADMCYLFGSRYFPKGFTGGLYFSVGTPVAGGIATIEIYCDNDVVSN